MKKSSFPVLLFLSVLLLVSCSSKPHASGSAMEPESASGGAMEPESASESAILGKTKEQKNSFSGDRLENSTNRYKANYGEEIVQYTLDGKKTGQYAICKEDPVIEYFELLFVSDHEMIIAVVEEGDEWNGRDFDSVEGVTFYQIPLTKGEDGTDEVHLSERKKLFTLEETFDDDLDLFTVYIDAGWMIGVTDIGKCFIYNREENNLKEDMPFGRGGGGFCEDCLLGYQKDSRELYAQFHSYQVDEVVSRLCCLDLNTFEWRGLVQEKHDQEIAYEYLGSWKENSLFSVEGDEKTSNRLLVLRDAKTDTTTSVATERDLILALKKGSFDGTGSIQQIQPHFGIGENDPDGNKSGFFQGKYYFEALTERIQDREIETCSAVFSFDIDKQNLTYEKKLTEKMWELGVYKYVKNPDGFRPADKKPKQYKKIRTNLADVMDFDGENVLLRAETSKGTKQAWVYSMKTGKVRKLKKGDKKWYSDWREWNSYDANFTDVFLFWKDLVKGRVIYEE